MDTSDPKDRPSDEGAEDAEIHDMMRCYGILVQFDEPTRLRMLQYLHSRLKEQP